MQMQSYDMLPDNQIDSVKILLKLINESESILVSTHLRPDGDAIGSTSGLVKSLIKAGKKVEVALVDAVPYRFKPFYPEVKINKETEQTFTQDLLLILDAGDASRTGITFKPAKPESKIVNIDHHSSNTLFGDHNYVDTSASSTCEMIASLLDYGKLPLDADVAIGLFLGLVTDSRFFQNEGVRHNTHLVAARLLQTGVDTSPVLNTLNSGRSEADLRLQGFGLSNFKLECDNRLATLVITQSDLNKLKANTNNIYASGIFNLMNSITTVIGTVVIFEREPGVSSCEFRSRGGLNVKDVAVSMGGGGHIPASGCSKELPVEQVANEAIEKMKKQVNDFLEQ